MDNNSSKEVIHKISENLNKESTAAIVRTLLKLHKYGGTTKDKLIDTLVIDENVPVVDAKMIVQSVLMAGVEFGAIIKVPDIVYKLDDEFYSFLVDYYSQNYDKNKYCKKKSSEMFQKYKKTTKSHRTRNSEKKIFSENTSKKRRGRRKRLPTKVVAKKPIKTCLKKETKTKKECQKTGGFWSSLFGFNKVKTRKITRRRNIIPQKYRQESRKPLQLKNCPTTHSNFGDFINDQRNMIHENLLRQLKNNHLLQLSNFKKSETMPDLICYTDGKKVSLPIRVNDLILRRHRHKLGLINEEIAKSEKFEEFLNNSPQIIVQDDCKSYRRNDIYSLRRSRSRNRGIVNCRLRKKARRKQQTYSTRRNDKIKIDRRVKSDSVLTTTQRKNSDQYVSPRRNVSRNLSKHSNTLITLNHTTTKWIPTAKSPKIIASPRPSYAIGDSSKNYQNAKHFTPNKHQIKLKKHQKKKKKREKQERKRRNYAEILEYKTGPYSLNANKQKHKSKKDNVTRQKEKKQEKEKVSEDNWHKRSKRKRQVSSSSIPKKKRRLYKVDTEEKTSRKVSKRKIDCNSGYILQSKSAEGKKSRTDREEGLKKINKRKLERNIEQNNSYNVKSSDSIPKKKQKCEIKPSHTKDTHTSKVSQINKKFESCESVDYHHRLERRKSATSIHHATKSRCSIVQEKVLQNESRLTCAHSKTPTFFFPFLKKGKKEKRNKKSKNMDRRYSSAYKSTNHLKAKQNLNKILRRMC